MSCLVVRFLMLRFSRSVQLFVSVWGIVVVAYGTGGGCFEFDYHGGCQAESIVISHLEVSLACTVYRIPYIIIFIVHCEAMDDGSIFSEY